MVGTTKPSLQCSKRTKRRFVRGSDTRRKWLGCFALADSTMNFTAEDGAAFEVNPKTDATGYCFEVLDGGGCLLGTIRFTTSTKTECDMRVPTADRYFVEIVTHLQGQRL